MVLLATPPDMVIVFVVRKRASREIPIETDPEFHRTIFPFRSTVVTAINVAVTQPGLLTTAADGKSKHLRNPSHGEQMRIPP